MHLTIYMVNELKDSWGSIVLTQLKMNTMSTLKLKMTQDYIHQEPYTFLGFVLGAVKQEELKCCSSHPESDGQ